MTLPIAEHGDVVTCTSGHRVGVIEHLGPEAQTIAKANGCPLTFAVFCDRHQNRTVCALCDAMWWRYRERSAFCDYHVEGRGWVRTSDDEV